MSETGPVKAWAYTLIATLSGALWLMLALPAFGPRPGDLVALSFRMRW